MQYNKRKKKANLTPDDIILMCLIRYDHFNIIGYFYSTSIKSS